jgi:pSer/pThr/pTyr-binding forkhead associated (FHA) protein
MIKCPSCRSQSYVGTFFCIDCGVALVDIPSRQTKSKNRTSSSSEPKEFFFDGTELNTLDEGAIMGLRALAAGEVISLHGRASFTLGHAVEGQSVIPDVDLGKYGADSHGISRLHAELSRDGTNIMITDLDSSNGTQVNGLFLEPNTPLRLHHGDVLKLGSLQLQILIRDLT